MQELASGSHVPRKTILPWCIVLSKIYDGALGLAIFTQLHACRACCSKVVLSASQPRRQPAEPVLHVQAGQLPATASCRRWESAGGLIRRQSGNRPGLARHLAQWARPKSKRLAGWHQKWRELPARLHRHRGKKESGIGATWDIVPFTQSQSSPALHHAQTSLANQSSAAATGTLNPRLGFAGPVDQPEQKAVGGWWARTLGTFHAQLLASSFPQPRPCIGSAIGWQERDKQPGSLDESTAAFQPFNSLANQTVFPLYIFRPKDERQSHSPTAPTSFRFRSVF